MKLSRTAFAAAVVTVYIVCPGYRYWVLGSWIGYKILSDKPRFTSVPKGSKVYNRLVGKTA